jgi:hypothetical protein
VPKQTPQEKANLLNQGQSRIGASRIRLKVSKARALQGGNIATIQLYFQGKVIFQAEAFSKTSALPKSIKPYFAPSIPRHRLGRVGYARGTQHANHTEPKLLESLRRFWNQSEDNDFDRIILASEMDCCVSCVKNTVNAVDVAVALMNLDERDREFIIIEVNSKRVSDGHEFATSGKLKQTAV